MDDTQAGSERNEDGKRKLCTYVSLGLIIGALFLLGRHTMRKRREMADKEDSPGGPNSSNAQETSETQLDRIEMKSDIRWWVTMVFSFFTVLVFGMALIGLVVNIENADMFGEAGWVIDVYLKLSQVLVGVGTIGMVYFGFRAYEAIQRRRGKR